MLTSNPSQERRNLYGSLHAIQIIGFFKSEWSSGEHFTALNHALETAPDWPAEGEIIDWAVRGALCPVILLNSQKGESGVNETAVQAFKSVIQFEREVIPYINSILKSKLKNDVNHQEPKFCHIIISGELGTQSNPSASQVHLPQFSLISPQAKQRRELIDTPNEDPSVRLIIDRKTAEVGVEFFEGRQPFTVVAQAQFQRVSETDLLKLYDLNS